MNFLWYNVCSLTCFGIAGAMALSGIEEGWGWFLFAGILVAVVPTSSKGNDDE